MGRTMRLRLGPLRRPSMDPQQDAQPPSKAQRPQDGAPGASAIPAADVPPEAAIDPTAGGGAPEDGPHEAIEGPRPQEEQDSIGASPLIEHPVYFVSTVLREARAHYPMPQKHLRALLIASRKLRHYFQGHPMKVVSAYPLERVL